MKSKAFKYTSVLAAAISAAAQADQVSEPAVSVSETTVIGDQVESHQIAVEPSITSKLQGSIEDIPRSIDIISSEQFSERGAINLQETLNYTPGVFAGAFGLDTRIDTNRIRGLSPQQFQDGFMAFEGFYNAPRVEVYTLENIEVVKGPSSTLFGQGALGGIVNANSKLPKEEAGGELSVTVGSDNRFQTGVDSTGALNEDGSLLYRVVALGRNSETEVDFVNDDAVIFMPSLTWKATEETEVTFLANHQKHETGSTIQFISDLDTTAGTNAGLFGTDTLSPLGDLGVNPKTYVGEPEFDQYTTESDSFSAILDHKINDTFSVSANIRYWESESNYQYTQPLAYSFAPPGLRLLPFGPAGAILSPELTAKLFALPVLDTDGDVYRIGYKSDKELNIFANNIVFKADTNWLGLDHSAQFGIDYVDADTKDNRARDRQLEELYALTVGGPGSDPSQFTLSGYFLTDSKINLVNPEYSGAPIVPTETEYRDSSNQQTGVFLSDVITHDNLVTSFNLRYDYVRQSYDRKGIYANGNDSTSWTDSVEDVNTDAAIMYQFENGISPYYSYAESFTPNDADPEGNLVDPREGSQHEVGVKYLSESGDTFVTAAVFQIDEDNRVTNPDPVDFNVISATYEGAELSVKQRISEVFVQGSYSYLETEQKEDAAAKKVPNVPNHMANVWVSYVPNGGSLNGFRMGGGARHIGNTFSDQNNYRTASYTLYDAMLGYRFKDFDLQLNVNNLADKDYTAAISESNFGISSYEGQGRFASLTAKLLF